MPSTTRANVGLVAAMDCSARREAARIRDPVEGLSSGVLRSEMPSSSTSSPEVFRENRDLTRAWDM
eukprot:scaffold703_cov245-Pinguiococcus_pyrenoidosus.AAC.16